MQLQTEHGLYMQDLKDYAPKTGRILLFKDTG
jgi:hypothetical protein